MTKTGHPNLKDELDNLKTNLENILSNNINNINTDINEIDLILNLTHKQLASLDSVKCQEYNIVLTRHIMYLYKQINLAKSVKSWAHNKLLSMVARLENNYKTQNEYIKYEMLLNRIVNADSSAGFLSETIEEQNNIIQMLDGFINELDSFRKTLSSLSWSKKHE